ncbi:MAG: hypothetical protein GX595_02545 [Lentisphaerae bacterium]|nr:hypothetical protein [Lentisphaerota bacterium]
MPVPRPESTTPTGSAGPAAGAFFSLGALTLTVQAVLLREFFCVLHGSDLAFAFALAAWTAITAAGAVLAGSRRSWLPRCRALWPWGLVAHAGLAVAVFLSIRRWGAQAVIPFHGYLLIPVFLAPLCLVGGLLFPWYLSAGRLTPSQAWSWEVAGGLAAGVVSAVLYYHGALSAPLLLGGVVVCLAVALGPARARRRAWAMVPALGLAVVLPFSRPGEALECRLLGLRYAPGRVLAAANTPTAAMAAVAAPTGGVTVFENGSPWPAAEATPARAALLAALSALPPSGGPRAVVHALRSGFGPALAALPGGSSWQLVEADLAAVAFARRYRREGADTAPAVPFTATALDPRGGGWGLIAVLSPTPDGLLVNRALTREFAAAVRSALAPDGLFVVAVPVAPGFTHPGQEAWIETVREVFREGFPAMAERRTDLGWLLLIGAAAAPDLAAAARRLEVRCPGLSPGVTAEARGVLLGEGILDLDRLAGPAAAAPTARRAPVNRVGDPRACFRWLEFRGRLVEEAPRWWQWLFRERTASWAAVLVAALAGLGWCGRPARSVQGVFWASWTGTAALITAVYLYQSLAGAAFWAVSLLSAASLTGILCGTRVRPTPRRDALAALAALVPAALWLLHGHLGGPAGVSLAVLLAAVGLAGAALGHAFARRGGLAGAPPGGRLYAADLLGSGAGLFLGGALLPWWCGFEAAAVLAGLAAAAMLVADAVRRRA